MSDDRPPHAAAREVMAHGYEYLAELLGAVADELQRDAEDCTRQEQPTAATKLRAAAILLCDAQAAVVMAWRGAAKMALRTPKAKGKDDVDIRDGGESPTGSEPRS